MIQRRQALRCVLVIPLIAGCSTLMGPRDPVQVQLASGELSVKKTTRIIEEILIRRALQKTKGNRTRAAEVLEISHRALLYKIKDYQITDL